MKTLIELVKERIKERDQRKLDDVRDILMHIFDVDFFLRIQPIVFIVYFNVKKRK